MCKISRPRSISAWLIGCLKAMHARPSRVAVVRSRLPIAPFCSLKYAANALLWTFVVRSKTYVFASKEDCDHCKDSSQRLTDLNNELDDAMSAAPLGVNAARPPTGLSPEAASNASSDNQLWSLVAWPFSHRGMADRFLRAGYEGGCDTKTTHTELK
jgi:hypothetical protein